jgi:hypothetical protein
MKTYKQIEQRVEESFDKLHSSKGFSSEHSLRSMWAIDVFEAKDFLKTHLKQAILDFYEEVVPKRRNPPHTEPYKSYVGWYKGFNDCIDQLNKSKEEFFKE